MREDVQHQGSEPCAGPILRAELSPCTFHYTVQCCLKGWISFSQKWGICLSAGVGGDGTSLGSCAGLGLQLVEVVLSLVGLCHPRDFFPFFQVVCP